MTDGSRLVTEADLDRIAERAVQRWAEKHPRPTQVTQQLTLAKISGHKDLRILQDYYRETAGEIAARL